MFVMLAKKKVKRQCSSKRFVKSKATAELFNVQAGPGITGARKQEGKNASGLDMLPLNDYM